MTKSTASISALLCRMTKLTNLLMALPICCHGSLLGWLGGSSTYPAPVPPPGSRRVHGAPAYAVNEPSTSVYLGQGCFWHTQYDLFRIERDPAGPFRRAGKRITALAGYAGGGWTAPAGRVCYHGEDASDYSLLGHAEAVEVQLDNGNGARRQMRALLEHYFAHGFVEGKAGQPGRRRDPQDGGPQYRNVVGLPGGRHGAKDGLFAEVAAAAAAHAMPLRDGLGGAAGDTADERVVYVYDSDAFPFFRAEAYHQVLVLLATDSSAVSFFY
jgi:peptide methionine sulfoxide reductase MsrA